VVLIISIVSGIVNVMCLVIPAAVCLFIVFFGSHYNSFVSSVDSGLRNVKTQYQFVYWKIATPELLKLGDIKFNC